MLWPQRSITELLWLWVPGRALLARDDEQMNLSQHRQLDHVIGMADRAFAHGILQLKLEPACGADATLGRERPAKHGAAVRQLSVGKAAREQFRDRQHRVQGSLLIELPLAADPGIRTQDHPVPVTDDLLQFPQRRRDRLFAPLLGDCDAVALDLAVGMVGAEADENSSLPADQPKPDPAPGISTAT